MQWRPAALFERRLHIDRIEIAGVDVEVGEAPPAEPTEPAPPALITPGKKHRPFGLSKDFRFIDDGSGDELDMLTSPTSMNGDAVTPTDAKPAPSSSSPPSSSMSNLQKLYDRLMNNSREMNGGSDVIADRMATASSSAEKLSSHAGDAPTANGTSDVIVRVD